MIVINVFHILSGWHFLRKRKLLSRDRSAHTAKRMCPTEQSTTGETPRARTRAKVVISCSTFSNVDHGYSYTLRFVDRTSYNYTSYNIQCHTPRTQQRAVLKFVKPIPVQFSRMEAVDKELHHLGDLGIITRVDHSEWATHVSSCRSRTWKCANAETINWL